MKIFIVGLVVMLPTMLSYFKTVGWLMRNFWKRPSSGFKTFIKAAFIYFAGMVVALTVLKIWSGVLLYFAKILDI